MSACTSEKSNDHTLTVQERFSDNDNEMKNENEDDEENNEENENEESEKECDVRYEAQEQPLKGGKDKQSKKLKKSELKALVPALYK